MTLWHKFVAALVVALAVVAAGCSGWEQTLRRDSESKEVVLVTHDSFAIPKQVKAAFEQESGLKLTILQGGDAGEMVNRALLTKGNPQGDVLFGIDNNLLSRALDEGLFEPYIAAGSSSWMPPTGSTRPTGDADRPRRRLPQRRPEVVRLAWSCAATVARRPDRSRATRTCSSSRTPPPRRPGSRSCSPRSRSSARAAGRTTGASCGPTACSPSTAGRRRTPPAFPAPAAARASGPSSSPTRRARRPRSFSRRRRRRPPRRPSSPTAASARSSSPACSTARRTRRARGCSSTSCSRSSSRHRCRRACSCCRCATARPCRRRSGKYAVSPPTPLELPAAEIGSNRDRWIDEWTQVVLR